MKLLIADDHTLFRDALAQYIERFDTQMQVTLVKDFHDVMGVLQNDPDFQLVILDLGMPGMSRMEGLVKLKEHYPHIPFALMSGIAEPHDVQEAIRMGAVGYFPKTLPGKSMIEGIKQIIQGKPFIAGHGASDGLMPAYYGDRTNENKDRVEAYHFTPREKEVLAYLVGGAANKEIARALNLQIVTIKLHVRGICRKLNVQNRTQAALKAKEIGITPIVYEANHKEKE